MSADHQVQTKESPAPVLPAEKMLSPLRKRAGELWTEIVLCDTQITRYAKYKSEGAEAWANERIAAMETAKAERVAEFAALEQAIKVLEVLLSSKFLSVENNSNIAYSVNVAVPSGKDFWSTIMAETTVAALLKAHESLYPSTQPAAAPSGPDKEEQ